MTTKREITASALSIAYETVISIGFTHHKLIELNMGVNYPTLRRIRDQKELKKVTERFYLKLFVGLINDEYERRVTNGGDGVTSILIKLNTILLAEIGKA